MDDADMYVRIFYRSIHISMCVCVCVCENLKLYIYNHQHHTSPITHHTSPTGTEGVTEDTASTVPQASAYNPLIYRQIKRHNYTHKYS